LGTRLIETPFRSACMSRETEFRIQAFPNRVWERGRRLHLVSKSGFLEFSQILASVLDGHEIAPEALTRLLTAILSGELGEAETAAFLIALRMKGETVGELATAASLLRERMVRLETGRSGLLDTCGTGGDGCGTFNISTAAAIVAAAAGVPVVKHGNRAVSSCSGSADVLTELGVKVDAGPDWAKRCLDATGLAFCFAPHFHPALKQVADLRRR